MSKEFRFTEAKIDAYLSIDESEGRRLVGRLAKAFIHSIPVSLTELDVAMQKNDWEQVRFVSHKLISTCGNLGFSSMMDLSIAIESSSGSAEHLQTNYQAILSSIQILREHYSLACNALKNLNFRADAA